MSKYDRPVPHYPRDPGHVGWCRECQEGASTVKMSEVRAAQPAPEPPSPSQIVHAPRGSAPRSVRRQAAKASQQGRVRRVRKAQARILREFGRAGQEIKGATKAQRKIANGS